MYYTELCEQYCCGPHKEYDYNLHMNASDVTIKTTYQSRISIKSIQFSKKRTRVMFKYHHHMKKQHMVFLLNSAFLK